MKLKKKHAMLLLKITVIAACFAVIYSKADTTKIAQYLSMVNPLAILLSYAILTLAQFISALRTQYYFRQEGLHLKKKFTVGLYFVGMLFNNVLPGGIGGDGYKLYLVNKLANFPRMYILRIFISERASGLFALLLLGFLIAPFSEVSSKFSYANVLIIPALLITTAGYFTSIKILLKEKPKTAIGAMPYSLVIQLLGIAIILTIFFGTGINSNNSSETNSYIILFLISSVLSILPISIGGVGLRELTFMYGGALLGLNPELGITIAIVYIAVNLLCSLNGLIFWHRLEKLYK
jgi:uncharacterized membrane protein YbhN (UPF0104 family)